MKSPTGIVAALAILLALPAAVLFNALAGGNSETIVHFMVGAGFLLFAVSIFSFGLPRWLNWIGALGAAAFGGIFVLQGISEVLDSEALRSVAFGVLGHEVERVLPDVVFVWFLGLLLAASTGKTRIIGWVVMPVVVGIEVAAIGSVILGLDFPIQKMILFLPFVWFLVESIKRPSAASGAERARVGDLATAEPA